MNTPERTRNYMESHLLKMREKALQDYWYAERRLAELAIRDTGQTEINLHEEKNEIHN